MKFVKKRSGDIVSYDVLKIKKAIKKAFEAVNIVVGQERIDSLIEEIEKKLVAKGKETLDIEEIQDAVEVSLLENHYFDVGKAYILYRERRRESRDTTKVLGETVKIIEEYLSMDDWRVRENSNMDYSLQGLNWHIVTKFVSNYWLERIFGKEIRDLHKNGDFHIHDLGNLSTYCVGWDLQDLLTSGFGGVFGKIESGPPKHFHTALNQVVNFFYTLQGESAGAQAFSNFDTLLAPFIRKDKLTYKEVKQCLQEFIFNLNIPTRVGFQSPFTNLTMDIVCPNWLAEEHVVLGGEIQNYKYKELQDEIEIINRAIVEVMLEGDYKGRPFPFPIITYNLTSDFLENWEKYEYIWKLTARYGSPYFANYINSSLRPEDARSMCCRLRLDNRQIRSRGGIFSANPLTGSIGVVTINLPRIGYKIKQQGKGFDDFLKEVKFLMHKAKEALEIKRKEIERLTECGLYPYSKRYLYNIKRKTGQYWTNHFSTIGFIGMAECFKNMYDKDYLSNEGQDFAQLVLIKMNEIINEIMQETGNLYNLEATPAEGASFRLAKKDIDNFGKDNISYQGTPDAPYYTNSVHLPVNSSEDIFEVLNFQEPLQKQFTGGTVIHIFIGEEIDNYMAVGRLIKTIAMNYSIPYFSITPTFSICPVHGYIPGKHKTCPYEHTEEDLIRFGIEEEGTND